MPERDTLVEEIQLLHGIALAADGRSNEAISRLNKFLHASPHNPHADEASFWLGESYYQARLYPDAVFGGSKLWSDDVRRERAEAHGIAVEELEAFYASRSLLGREVTARDVAEAVAFLVSDRSRATTGCTIPVDGGVPGAFPR